jgi:hypothetical protein
MQQPMVKSNLYVLTKVAVKSFWTIVSLKDINLFILVKGPMNAIIVVKDFPLILI